MSALGQVKQRVKDLASRAAGTAKIQEEVDTLYFFLNRYVDIKKLPPATGELRKMQNCGAEMLAIFDELCQYHHLEYWLDYGTLLGAARHCGYIPWDDDIDVSMRREDWDKAAMILPSELGKLGFYVQVYTDSWFGFGYKRNETGLWMDVFCYESCHLEEPLSISFKKLEADIEKWLTLCRKNNTFSTLPKLSREDMKRLREKSGFSETLQGEGPEVLFVSPETEPRICKINLSTDFYPLSSLEFEGRQYPVPKNWNDLLVAQYGNYTEFPKTGVLHHEIDGVALSDIAKEQGVDLAIIADELHQIYDQIASVQGSRHE